MSRNREPDDHTLNAERAALLAYFSERAKADGVIVRPEGVERDMNLAQRLYWERRENREFSIAWGDSARPGLDGFAKDTGDDDERRLLYVFATVGQGFEPVLWRLYRGWMHDGMTEAAAFAILGATPPEFGDG